MATCCCQRRHDGRMDGETGVRAVTVVRGDVVALRDVTAAGRPGRAARRARRVRQRQVDAAAHRRRAAAAALRRGRHRRPTRDQDVAGRAPGRDGVRDRRADPVPRRGRQHGLGTAGAPGATVRSGPSGGRAGPGSSGSAGSCTASRTSSPRASAGWSASAGRWCRRRGRSCSTSRWPTWTRPNGCGYAAGSSRWCGPSAVTTLYVTHDPTEALAVADRVALLHEGRVRQLDRPGTLYDRRSTWSPRPRSRRSAWCRRGSVHAGELAGYRVGPRDPAAVGARTVRSGRSGAGARVPGRGRADRRGGRRGRRWTRW